MNTKIKFNNKKMKKIRSVLIVLGLALGLSACTHGDHWSLVYEAVQTPEVPGGPARFARFVEDGISHSDCADLFFEKIHVLNNNASVVSYDVWCDHLGSKGFSNSTN